MQGCGWPHPTNSFCQSFPNLIFPGWNGIDFTGGLNDYVEGEGGFEWDPDVAWQCGSQQKYHSEIDGQLMEEVGLKPSDDTGTPEETVHPSSEFGYAVSGVLLRFA